MAIFKCSFYSEALEGNIQVNVVLPLPELGDYFYGGTTALLKKGEKYPVLYLLHGFGADYSDWLRYSSIERYAKEKEIAVVMPSGNNSFYNNFRNGGRFYDFYTSELPDAMERLFPIADEREHRYIGGLSMGGFGAMKAALTKPEKYGAVISLSGAYQDLNPQNDGSSPSPVNTHGWRCAAYGAQGEFFDPNHEDMAVVLRNCARDGILLPDIFIACGTEDYLYQRNQRIVAAAREAGLSLTYVEGPGIHNWVFWDQYIQSGLDWLMRDGRTAAGKGRQNDERK